MLRVCGVTRIFHSGTDPVHALRGVDLEVADGSLTAVLGPSGCGKTTLLRVMAGFDRPDRGEVRLDGRLIAGPGVFVAPERRSIGVVAQEGALFPHLSTAANVAYGLPLPPRQRLSPSARAARRDRVEQMLELVGLPGMGERRPDELSGGQQQRVALARALAPEPAVLLLDEPFSALDAALRVELREEVRDLLRSIGATAVLVTHDQAEALSLADRVAMMRDGRVIQFGTPAAVYAHPVDPEAAAFLGESMELPCRVAAAVPGTDLLDLQCPLGAVRVAATAVYPSADKADTGRLVLRPEQLLLAESGTPAVVAATSYFGHDGLAQLDLADGTRLLVRLDGRRIPPVGAEVRVRVSPELEAMPGVPA